MFDNITIFYNDAERYINAFNAQEIIFLLKKRIKSGEKTAQNYAFLAEAYFVCKKSKTALRYALKAKRIDENYYYADFVLTEIYNDEEKYAKAEKYLRNLLENAPDDYYLKYFAALLVYTNRNGFDEKTKGYARKLLSLDYDEPWFFFVKSFAYISLLDFKNALKFIFKLMAKSLRYYYYVQIPFLILIFQSFISSKFVPNLNLYNILLPHLMTLFGVVQDEELYYSLSNMELNQEKALNYIENAIKIKDKPVFQIKKADILYNLDQYEEAIDICEKICEEDNSYIQCYDILCKCYRWIENYQKCLKYANLSLLNNGFNETIVMYKVKCLLEFEKYKQALDTIKKYGDYLEDSDNIYFYYYLEVGNYEKALLCINKLILKDNNHDNLLKKARVLGLLKRFEDAIKICEAVLKEDDKNSVAYYWMAASYYSQEKYDIALEYCNMSIALDGKDMWDFVLKYNILKDSGRIKESEFAYKKAVELGYDGD